MEGHMMLQANRNQPRIANAGNLYNGMSGATGAQLMPLLRLVALLALATLLFMAAGAQAQLVFPTPQAVNTTSGAVSVTVSSLAAGAVTNVEVLTVGQSGLDFAAVTSGSTCTGKVFAAAKQTCTQSVTFTPAYPGSRVGAVVLLGGNTVLGTGYLSGVGVGGLDVLTPGNVLQIAGVFQEATGASGPSNGGPANRAALKQPSSVALDGAGNVYIADSADNEVRMVCAGANSATIAGVTGCTAAGIIIDVAGGGAPVSSPIVLDSPSGIAVDGAGNLYIADTSHQIVEMMSVATGNITTVAGNGTAGYRPADDGGLATAAELNFPEGVSIDANGNLFIADTTNGRIRKVDAVTGIITTVAGGGTGTGALATDASLNQPYAVAFDLSGNMYIPDSGNNIVREVKEVSGAVAPSSTITTVAGTGIQGTECIAPTAGSTPLNTALNLPSGVAVDPAGNLYISDTRDECVRKTNLVTGQIINLAESGFTAIGTNNALPLLATGVYSPVGITVDSLGNVYFADYYDMVIEEVQSNKVLLDFTTPVLEGSQSAKPMTVNVENDGNDSSSPSSLTAVTALTNAAVDLAATTCAPIPYSLAEDNDCIVSAYYAPTTTGNPLGFVDVTGNTANDDNANAPLTIVLAGTASKFTITLEDNLTATPPVSAFGSPITFTATVAEASGTPSGSVTFTDSLNSGAATTLNTVTLSGGVAVYVTSSLAVGSHTVTATYGTDQSTATVNFVVYEATKTTLSAVPPSPSGSSVVFTANISGPNGGGQVLSGTVTFTDSLTTFANNTVAVTTSGATGTASFSATGLPLGTNVITAQFTPTPASPALVGASSATLNQDVQGASTLTVSSNPNSSVYGSPVVFTVGIPTVGSAGATGNVTLKIAPVGGGPTIATLTAPLSGNPAAGTATISTLPVGSYNVTATYAGNTTYGASTGALASPQVVTQVQTTTALAAKPNPGIAGQSVAITATVTPASGTVAATGTVTFTATLNGVSVALTGAANVALTGGAATIRPTLGPGTYVITAAYSGDTDDAAGTAATLSLVINQATTTTTVTAAPSPSVVGGTITFTATVATTPAGGTPTGTVTFSAAGTSGTVALGNGTLTGGKATVTSATLPGGTYTITASYGGDANDAVSTGTTTETVGLIATTTDLTTATVNSADVLVAIVQNSGTVGPTPTGTVTFTSGTATVGSATLDANGVATLTPNLPTGNYTIVAAYGGDADHSPSTSTSINITGVGSNFSLSVSPSTVTLQSSQNAAVGVTLTSISGFADTINLGCAGLPAGVNCEFSSISVPLSANGTATAQLTIDTNNPLGGGATAMNKQGSKPGVSMAGLFMPFSLLLGCIVWRFRKQNAHLLSMVLLLILGGATMLATGCGGFTQSSAAAGTYTIQVVGVGEKSNVTAYQSVTLTITK
jgi:sugar lactone lactonase YvrE